MTHPPQEGIQAPETRHAPLSNAERQRRWRERNPEDAREQNRRYKANNLAYQDRERARHQRRTAARRLARTAAVREMDPQRKGGGA